MLRRFLLTFIVVNACAYSASAAIYRLPITKELTKATPPKGPFPPRKTVSVHNMFGQGQFGSLHTEYFPVGNRFVRGPTVHINTLQGLNPRDDQECGDILLANSVMQRHEHTAFSDMHAAGYMPTDKPYEDYLNLALQNYAEQLTYIESTTWLTVPETLALFDGIIPWERVAEVDMPKGGMNVQAVRDFVPTADENTRLRVRRGVIKLVAGHVIPYTPPSPLAGTMDSFMKWGGLPWQNFFQDFVAGQPVQGALHFELTRATQLESFNMETDRLVPFAAAIAYHHALVLNQRPEDVRMYAVSFRENRTELFRRRLAMKPWVAHETDGHEHTLLSGTLADLFETQRPSRLIEPLGKLRAYLDDKPSEDVLIRLLYEYQRTLRIDWDMVWNGDQTSASGGPIIFRDYSVAREKKLKDLFAQTLPWYKVDKSFDGLIEIFRETPRIEGDPGFMFQRDDIFESIDWEKTYGISPLIVSNLSSLLARTDPHYTRKVLMLVANTWNPRVLPWQYGRQVSVVFASRSPEVAAQLRALGLLELKKDTYFMIPLSDLYELKTQSVDFHAELSNSALVRGFWERYRTLSDLRGI